MGLLNLFSGKKKLDGQKVFDDVSSGIDKLFYTNEEKADQAQKAVDTYLEWYRLTLNENSARSITRRYLAIMFASVYLLLLVGSAVAKIFNDAYATHLWDLSKTLGPYVGGIMGFYFMYYGVQSILKDSKSKEKPQVNLSVELEQLKKAFDNEMITPKEYERLKKELIKKYRKS